jgi:hypothetical protein
MTRRVIRIAFPRCGQPNAPRTRWLHSYLEKYRRDVDVPARAEFEFRLFQER